MARPDFRLHILFKFPGAMAATTLTAISPLEMVFFRENDIAFRCQVVIFFFKLIGERHFVLTNLTNFALGSC